MLSSTWRGRYSKSKCGRKDSLDWIPEKIDLDDAGIAGLKSNMRFAITFLVSTLTLALPVWSLFSGGGSGLTASIGKMALEPGTYFGSYNCAQGNTNVTVEIYPGTQNQLGRFSFQKGSVSGSYDLEISRSGDEYLLMPGAWIRQPHGYTSIPARVSRSGDRLDGRILSSTCGEIHLVREASTNTLPLKRVEEPDSVPMEKYRSLLDETMVLDAAYWFTNRFQAGSVRNLQVQRKGSNVLLRGEFGYSRGGPSGMQIAWVEAEVSGGRIACLRYWDDADSCDAPRGDPLPYLEPTTKAPLTAAELSAAVVSYGFLLKSKNTPPVPGSMSLKSTPDSNGRVFGTWKYQNGVQPNGSPTQWSQKFFIERLPNGAVCLRENAESTRPCANLSINEVEANRRRAELVRNQDSERRQVAADMLARKPGSFLNAQDRACLIVKYETQTRESTTNECVNVDRTREGPVCSRYATKYEDISVPYEVNKCNYVIRFKDYCGTTVFSNNEILPGARFNPRYGPPCERAY